MKTIFCFIFYFFISYLTIAKAQTDTSFWFVAPEITKASSNLDRPILMRITAYSISSIVKITQPANSNFPTQTISINSNSVATINLTNWIDIIENKPANTILNYGFKITSTNPVTIYYEISSANNPEIFVLKGNNALGTDFWISSQNFLDNSTAYIPNTNSSFDLVATNDATTVTIIPSNDIIGHNKNIPFTIILNKGQTYSATAVSNLSGNHLNGSRVLSDKSTFHFSYSKWNYNISERKCCCQLKCRRNQTIKCWLISYIN